MQADCCLRLVASTRNQLSHGSFPILGVMTNLPHCSHGGRVNGPIFELPLSLLSTPYTCMKFGLQLFIWQLFPCFMSFDNPFHRSKPVYCVPDVHMTKYVGIKVYWYRR